MLVRKKPIIVEAWEINPDDNDKPNFVLHGLNRGKIKWVDGVFTINTLEGRMQANDGDYLIKGVRGELYACRRSIFNETYEKYSENFTEILRSVT